MRVRHDNTDRPSLRLNLESPRVVLLTGLILVRLADMTVTWAGLQIGLVEANPIAAAIMNVAGVVPGMIGTSAGVILMLVVVVEASVALLQSNPQIGSDGWVSLLRRVSYTSVLLFWSAVVVYNSVLVTVQVV